MAPRTVSQELADQLARSNDDIDRMATARALAALGAEAADATLTLESLLVTGEPPVAAAAAFVLAEIGPPALDASPALLGTLIGRLTHQCADVRQWTAIAIGRLGARAAPTAFRLAERLDDEDEGVRVAALNSLTLIHPEQDAVVDRLVKALEDPVSDIRRKAAEALHSFVPLDHHALYALAQIVDRGTPEAQVLAACILIHSDHHVRESMEALYTALEHDDAPVRLAAVEGVAHMSHVPQTVIHALTRRLIDSDTAVRYEAGCSLRALGAQAAPAAPMLLAALRDPEPSIRIDTLDVLSEIYPHSGDMAEAVQLGLVNCLGEEDGDVRRKAGAVLRDSGAFDGAAQEMLMRFLGHENPEVRADVIEMLRYAPDPNPAVHTCLRRQLDKESGTIRVKLCDVLAHLGAPIDALTPALLEEISGTNAAAQQAALDALETLHGPSLCSVLEGRLDDVAPGFRNRIRQTLDRLASQADPEEALGEQNV